MIKNAKENKIIEQNENILTIFTKYLNLYIDYKIATNLSKKTIYNIKIVLERFYDYIVCEFEENSKLSILDMNKYFLTNYINNMANCGLNKNSQALHITIIKNFLVFISDSNINEYKDIKHNITGIKIKTEQKEKQGFTQSEINRLLDYIKELDKSKNFLAQRNSLLIKMLLYTGLRISEVINIKWPNIFESEDEIHGVIYTVLVKGKGDKERYTYIAYSEIASNIEYLKEYTSKKSEYLFTTTHGNICNRSMLFLVVKHILEKAKIFKTGLHIFRHTFARMLVGKEVNLSTIKELLGHSNISITAQFYAKSNENAKRNALLK